MSCAVPNCTRATSKGKLMCLHHWRLVPLRVQFDVYRTWGVFKRARGRNFKAAAARAYLKAKNAAIAYITNQQRGELSA